MLTHGLSPMRSLRTRQSAELSHDVVAIFTAGDGPSSPTASTRRRIEVDSLEDVSFSESFSAMLDLDLDHGEDLLRSPDGADLADVSYNIENITNLKEIVPEWEHNEIDEIMVISPKHRLPKISEEDYEHGNAPNITKQILDPLSILSVGPRARLELARHRDEQRLYSVKALHQDSAQALQIQVRSERRCLEMVRQLDRPYLTRLLWTYEDEERMCLVTDFYPGGNLLAHLQRHGAFSPDRALQYACEIADGIASLHSLSIIHGDLRPENVMLDSAGHIVLTEFGSAKALASSVTHAGESIAAVTETVAYHAPEVLLGWAHDLAVDCWGFGVLLYMMLYGRHPFTQAESAMENETAVRTRILQFPPPFHLKPRVELSARDLIVKCLERNSAVRPTIHHIKAHRYFSSINWSSVSSKSSTAPVMTPTDGIIDLQYYDNAAQAIPIDAPLLKPVPLPPSSHAETPHDSSEISDSKHAHNRSQGSVASALPINEFIQFLHESTSSKECRNAHEDPEVPRMSDSKGRHQLSVEERHQAFWDNISLDVQSEGADHLSMDDLDDLASPRRSQKLRKSRSSAQMLHSFTPLSPDSHRTRNKLRRKSLGPAAMQASILREKPAPVDLPNGLKQMGSGIGYTRKEVPIASPTGFIGRVLHAKRRVYTSLRRRSDAIENLSGPSPSLLSSSTATSPYSPFYLSSPATTASLRTPDSQALLFGEDGRFTSIAGPSVRLVDPNASLLFSKPSFL